MCVLYVSFGSKVRPITFGCISIGRALLFIYRCRLLICSAGSGLAECRLFCLDLVCDCFVLSRKKTLCRYCCMYFLAALMLVDVIVKCKC